MCPSIRDPIRAPVIPINSDVYFEASALLEPLTEYKHSEQAVTPKILTFSSLPLILPPPDTLELDLNPAKTWTKQGECGRGVPQPCLVVPSANLQSERATSRRQTPRTVTVETKRKAKWPPQGQAVERGRVPEWSPASGKNYIALPRCVAR
jgi:hypothetical protein